MAGLCTGMCNGEKGVTGSNTALAGSDGKEFLSAAFNSKTGELCWSYSLVSCRQVSAAPNFADGWHI